MDTHFLHRRSQPPRHSGSQQVRVSKGSEEQRQSVYGRCVGPGSTPQLPRFYDVEDSICDSGRRLGVWIVGVGYVHQRLMWDVCARPRGLYESIVWEGVEEGDGAGKVEDGPRHLVKLCTSSFASSSPEIV